MRSRGKLELKEAKIGRKKSKKLLGSGESATGELWKLDILGGQRQTQKLWEL